MRFILSILLALPLLAQGQLCSEPSPVSYAGFGAQQTQADFFPGADYLDGLNNSSYWSLGSGISDNNLCIKENSDITTFLGVKLRNTTAPNDNTASAGNVYFVEPGYSPASQNGPTGSGPEATWNILMYAGIDGGAFDSVQVVLHIDFDPCYGYTEEDMYSIDIGSAFEANPFTQASDFSSFGINTNLGSTEIANLNPAGTGFDATIEGYYTFAIEVLNNCGTRRMWNEITVYVQSETTAEGDAVADANGNGVYDDNEVDGCQLSAACNYDCNATTNSGCEYTSCSGCTVSDACNYNSEATIPDSESCQYPLDIYGVSYVDCDGNCTTDSDSDGVCDEAEVVGCQDETACNFNANATDAGSCEFATTYYDCNDVCLNDADADGVCDELEVNGCTAGSACNYDEDATEDDGSCDYATCAGCTVVSACNYDAGKSISDLASCVYATGCDSCSGETDGTGTVVDGDSDNDGVCNDEEIDGCTDATACNYDSNATDDDGSCSILDALGVCGGSCSTDADGDGICDDVDNCTNTSACNYNASANEACDLSSCAGCTVTSACNYDSGATISSSTCVFANTGNCESCSGEQDGSGTIVDGDSDNDGVCDTDEVPGCTSTSACNYSSAATDDDGSCASLDALGVCGGSCSTDADNDGICDDADNCTNTSACNYNDSANEACDLSSCAGCTVTTACNYDSSATISTATCVYANTGDCESCSGEQDGSGTIVDGDSDNDGVCDADEVSGCTSTSACNYSSAATDDDGSCASLDALGVCGGSCSTDADNDGICDDVDNCTDTSACNYNDSANEACESTSCAGCTVDSACNYDSSATISLDVCTYATGCDTCSGAQDGSGTIVDGDTDNDGVCNANEVQGCTDNTQCNFNPLATDDDGTCLADIQGCTIESDCNYNPAACTHLHSMCSPASGGSTACSGGNVGGNPPPVGMLSTCENEFACNYQEEGACEFTSCVGCMNTDGCDYDVNNLYPALCDYSCYGCTNASADNYDSEDPATIDDGSCIISGCTTIGACNYDAAANNDDGSCEVTSCVGCGTPSACNYDSSVTLNEPISCVYATGCDSCSGETDGTGSVVDGDSDDDGVCNADEVGGCTNASACNYNSSATDDDGSCLSLDACGVCGGTGVDSDGDGVCDANEVLGCTQSAACNYDASATENSGCDFTSCVGCMESNACNYDASATLNELLQCVYATGCDSCSGETDGTGSVVDGDSDDDGVCNADEIGGCTIASACNYNSLATDNDGSCLSLDACGVCGGTGVDSDGDGVCDANEVLGCTLSAACNYSEAATENDGTCDFISCVGCMDESACNFDPSATLNQLLDCTYAETGYDCSGTCNNDSDTDGICDEFEVPGCTDSSACNYSASATDNDGSCTYPSEDYLDCDGNCTTDEDEDGVCDELEVFGCDIASACNYSAEATENDGTCEFSSCAGCTIPTACNYDETATLSNNVTCTYIPEGWDDCDQTICTDSDNDGICDFDEPAGCVGEFNEPHLSLSGVVETAVAVGDWSSTDFAGASSDDTGVQSTTFVDYIGRLADGRYSVTRVYTVTDVCANTSQAGQLLIADETHPSGCTNANATSYEPDAINDDGSCDYSPACLGDLNLDNIVGTSDLLILLSSFGLPCAE